MPTGITPSNQTSLTSLLVARAGGTRPGDVFVEVSYTWAEVVVQSAIRAALIAERIDRARPPHIGVLLDNEPEYLFWLGGAALAGATIVGINPTRRGAELARDVAHTDCQFVVTGEEHRSLLPDDPGVPVLDIGSTAYGDAIDRHRGATVTDDLPDPDTPLFLMFTSGSTSDPKAVRCSNGRAGSAGLRVAAGYGITAEDVCYCQMPLFHGNALLACWAPALATGVTVVLRRRFSASGFLDDVRRYGCTYFTYVGRSLAYVLAQSGRPDDGDNTLRLGFGTEASPADRAAFTDRFGCSLVEGYGSSESAIVLARTPDTPEHALGIQRDSNADIAVVDAATGNECQRARFGADGSLLNGAAAIGEMVNRAGGAGFDGYYNNPEATAERLRDGWYWSGDLAYRDEGGYFYFAGRTDDRLRVDGENFSTEPVAVLLSSIDGVAHVAVYAVPDERTGDQVMAALELDPGRSFDPAWFRQALESQSDLGTKWAPRFVRIVDRIPVTANNKLYKPGLRAAAFVTDDPVWWRPERDADYEPFDEVALAALRGRYATQGRESLLPK
ncbi:MAG: AMP-binding protein [Acidimicrobiia bacterium]|nr:AMP-binding protein [Acidimicrobiia bacterium]